MSSISLDDYYSAGYFLIRKSKRQSWLDEPIGLVPDEIISLENEFSPKFHLGWGWGSDDRSKALDFGITELKWGEFEKWCADHYRHEIEVWSMFRSTNAVRRFIEIFIPKTKQDGLTIIGVGLHKSCIGDWQDPHGTEGVELRILQQMPMEAGGQILGFDIASYAHHNFDHTWLSHGHYRNIFEELDVRPSEFSLIQTREEAILARDYTDAHDGYTYEYWLLVEYPY